MYTKQEQEVLNLLRQVKDAYKVIGISPKEQKRRSQSARRDDSYPPDEEARAFFRGILQLETIVKAKAADRINEMDLNEYVKAFVKDQHPSAEDITFKVDFVNKEVTKSKMNIKPGVYGGTNTTVEGRVHEGDMQLATKSSQQDEVGEDDDDC